MGGATTIEQPKASADAMRMGNKLESVGDSLYSQGTKLYNSALEDYQKYQKQIEQALANDYGADAAEYVKKITKAGADSGAQMANAAGIQSGRAAGQSALSTGATKGAAARQAAQAASQGAASNYTAGAQLGQQNYSNAAQQRQQILSGQQTFSQNNMNLGQGTQTAGAGTMNNAAAAYNNVAGTQLQVAQANQQAETANNNAVMGMIGSAAGGAASMVGMGSDKRIKDFVSASANASANADNPTNKDVPDSVPILAAPGEYVLSNPDVKQIREGNPKPIIDKVRNAYPNTYSEGGIITPPPQITNVDYSRNIGQPIYSNPPPSQPLPEPDMSGVGKTIEGIGKGIRSIAGKDEQDPAHLEEGMPTTQKREGGLVVEKPLAKPLVEPLINRYYSRIQSSPSRNNNYQLKISLGDYIHPGSPGYFYSYKETSGEDPNQLHYGPTAQDLLQDPRTQDAVMKGPPTPTTPDGTLTVNTNRLSLSNEGRITELETTLNNLLSKYREVG